MKRYLAYAMSITGSAVIALSLDFDSHFLWAPILGLFAVAWGTQIATEDRLKPSA